MHSEDTIGARLKCWMCWLTSILTLKPDGVQGSRVNCLAQTGLAAFSKGVQFISVLKSTNVTDLLAKRYTCHLIVISNHIWAQVTDWEALLT